MGTAPMSLGQLTARIAPKAKAWRREFHKYAETAWTEIRTGSTIVRLLREAGSWDVRYGSLLYDRTQMMGLPTQEQLEEHYQRAIREGADPEVADLMKEGHTGVLATLKVGGGDGPTVCFRVDIDANDLCEAKDEKHRPYREGFSSIHDGAMHGCGHDSHTAIGLGLAYVLAACKDSLSPGTVKIIFQTGEEGGRGGKPMAAAGIADDADYFVAIHVAPQMPVGEISLGVRNLISSTKMDALFTGTTAHAGGAPESGKNALLAACNATINLYAISRHSGGFTRVNVGVLQSGTGRNVIPGSALMKLEVRGQTDETNSYMLDRAMAILRGAAEMYGVQLSVVHTGECMGARMDPEMMELVRVSAASVASIKRIREFNDMKGGGEDCTFFMERIQKRGGVATIVNLGASAAAVLHNSYFDLDESVIPLGIELLAHVAKTALSRR